MTTIVSDYNLAAVQVTLDDFRVDGWSTDDAASVVPTSDLIESKVAADGSHVTNSAINDNTRTLTLTVARGTRAYRELYTALQDQIAAARVGARPDLAFSIFDPISGDKISERKTVFMREPDLAFNKSSSDAIFTLFLPNPEIIAGANIAITA